MRKKIEWTLIEVKASELKPNEHNPKVRNEKGFERLQKSMEKFGTVFHGIVNKDLSIIDGHSRLETCSPDDVLKVFAPSRQLSKREYDEFNAVYDQAKAGDFDLNIAFENLGQEFVTDWDFEFESEPQEKEDRFVDAGIAENTRYGIIVMCKDEAEQQRLFTELEDQGLECKIVMV